MAVMAKKLVHLLKAGDRFRRNGVLFTVAEDAVIAHGQVCVKVCNDGGRNFWFQKGKRVMLR